MSINSDILKYINTEKDLSKYQINILNKVKNPSLSQKRLMRIEHEFISLPLETIEFEDVADVATAISIYKTSRIQFYQTYNIKNTLKDTQLLLDIILNKLNYIKTEAHAHMHIRVQEINLVQNSDFYFDLIIRESLKNGTSKDIEKRKFDLLNIDELINIEPITISKKRARVQSVYYSIGKYLKESISDFSFDEFDSYYSLIQKNQFLDNIIYNLNDNIFKYYNDGLHGLQSILKNTMGRNDSLSKIHLLQNVLDFTSSAPLPINNPDNFEKNTPLLGNIFFGTKKIISKTVEIDTRQNKKNKVFGILLPITHKGNEKMTLWYKNIIMDNYNISKLFSDNFSNIKAIKHGKENYFKGVMLHPFWKLISVINSDDSAKYILSKLSGIINDLDLTNIDIIEKINSQSGEFFPIDKSSIVLTTKTRSEEEGLLEILPIINSKVLEIKEDFEKLNIM